MAGLFCPRTQGSVRFDPLPPDFTDRIRDRVEQGLLMRGSRVRANYTVREQTDDAIAFGAGDWWTAINIGLNEVDVRREGEQTLHYTVRFPRWTAYAVALCGVIAGFIALSFVVGGLLGAMREMTAGAWLATNAFVWGGVLFWGVVWPWVLAAFHKKHLRRFMERMLREELEDPA